MGHMVGPPVIGGVVGNIIGERVGEDLIRETGLDREGFAWSITSSKILIQRCKKTCPKLREFSPVDALCICIPIQIFKAS